MRRRTALQLLGALALPRALRAAPAASDEFFVFIHVAGGWDVTLWADPRNERRGLVEPASTANTDLGGIRHWRRARLAGGATTFEPLVPPDAALRLGPAIGDLFDFRTRLTIVNGLAMNTVSHADGTAFSTTGRHRAGGTVPASSIDVMVANELGTKQTIPALAVSFPSSFVGDHLDRRVIPLRAARAEALVSSLDRSDQFLVADDRAAMSALLAEEAEDLARASGHPQVFEQLASQHATLPELLRPELREAFRARALQARYPAFNFRARTQAGGTLAAACAIEAMQRNLVRCVGFGLGGLDHHGVDYRLHARTLQEVFAVVAALVRELDRAPHPTRRGARLSEHTHILALSEFCRAPQINHNGGRDHYPNNSALVISPRFRGGRTFGATDLEQLLPAPVPGFAEGPRPLAPPDLLATFVSAFGIDPRKYLRDGEVVKAMLA